MFNQLLEIIKSLDYNEMPVIRARFLGRYQEITKQVPETL